MLKSNAERKSTKKNRENCIRALSPYYGTEEKRCFPGETTATRGKQDERLEIKRRHDRRRAKERGGPPVRGHGCSSPLLSVRGRFCGGGGGVAD